MLRVTQYTQSSHHFNILTNVPLGEKKRPCDVELKGSTGVVNTCLYTNSPDVFFFSWAHGEKWFKRFSLIVTLCGANLSPLLLTNPGCLFVCLLVLTEYLGGDVLPVEQHAASDLSSFLHANAHLEALMDRDARHWIHVAFRLYVILTALNNEKKSCLLKNWSEDLVK